jgi:hypothetical protein
MKKEQKSPLPFAKKLSGTEMKKVQGGGPCGKYLCSNSLFGDWVYTGTCNATVSAICAGYVYAVQVNCSSPTQTYCTNQFQVP